MPELGADIRPAVTPAEARFEGVRRTVGLFLGPAVFIAILLVPFSNLSPAANRLAAVMSLVIVFWGNSSGGVLFTLVLLSLSSYALVDEAGAHEAIATGSGTTRHS